MDPTRNPNIIIPLKDVPTRLAGPGPIPNGNPSENEDSATNCEQPASLSMIVNVPFEPHPTCINSSSIKCQVDAIDENLAVHAIPSHPDSHAMAILTDVIQVNSKFGSFVQEEQGPQRNQIEIQYKPNVYEEPISSPENAIVPFETGPTNAISSFIPNQLVPVTSPYSSQEEGSDRTEMETVDSFKEEQTPMSFSKKNLTIVLPRLPNISVPDNLTGVTGMSSSRQPRILKRKRQETRTEKVVEKRGKVDTTPPETRPHLTRVRKEVILEFLRERPRASRDELTSIESVREIIQRLRQRNKRTGACTENDVQNWLSNPVFELDDREEEEEESDEETEIPVDSSSKDSTSHEGQIPSTHTTDPALRQLVKDVVQETIAALQSQQNEASKPAKRLPPTNLSQRQLDELWAEEIRPDSDATLLMENFRSLIHIPACSTPTTLIIQPTSWNVGKYPHPPRVKAQSEEKANPQNSSPDGCENTQKGSVKQESLKAETEPVDEEQHHGDFLDEQRNGVEVEYGQQGGRIVDECNGELGVD